MKTDLSNLNDKQREAVVSEDKRLLVLAGAGSGKTKTLLQKLIYLIEEKGVSPSSILAITFTKNATNEMIDRLIISADTTGVSVTASFAITV
ncbi:MAG: UvrD-helicase domain-containing protein [Chitinophagaceae bacterium]|nr:UvrD-helicase domain-containing protein [Chitinophagaceae bacterium]